MKAVQPLPLTAFNRLILTYQDAAYGLARYLLEEEQQVEDAMESAFQRAYQNFHSLPADSFRSWLLSMVINSCKEQLSRSRQNTKVRCSPFPLAAREGNVQAAICSLPLEMRLLIVLVEVWGLDYEEAAKITGLTKEKVKSNLAQARYQLMVSLSASS